MGWTKMAKINLTRLVTFSVIIGILLRLLLSVTTYHSDLGAFALAGKYIVGDNRPLTFYDALGSRTDMVFNYQPLAYLLPSAAYLPFKSIVVTTGDLLINRSWITSLPGSIQPILLLYKLPMLIADLLILLFIPNLFSDPRKKKISRILWSLNPIAIFVSSMMGQVDIIIALFLLLSLLSIKESKYPKAALFVALSALIKPIGLILLPILAISAFHYHKKISSALFSLLTGFGIYALGVLPYISSPYYRYYALFADQINKSTFAGIAIASGTVIPWFFIAYSFAIMLFWQKRISLNTAMLASLLSSLVFTHFHPQWLVWVMPGVIYFILMQRAYFYYIALLLGWLFVLLSFDSSLHYGLFIWISSSTLLLPASFNNLFINLVGLSRALLLSCLLLLYSGGKSHPPTV